MKISTVPFVWTLQVYNKALYSICTKSVLYSCASKQR